MKESALNALRTLTRWELPRRLTIVLLDIDIDSPNQTKNRRLLFLVREPSFSGMTDLLVTLEFSFSKAMNLYNPPWSASLWTPWQWGKTLIWLRLSWRARTLLRRESHWRNSEATSETLCAAQVRGPQEQHNVFACLKNNMVETRQLHLNLVEVSLQQDKFKVPKERSWLIFKVGSSLNMRKKNQNDAQDCVAP